MDLVVTCKLSVSHNWNTTKEQRKKSISPMQKRLGYPNLGGDGCSTLFSCGGVLSSRWIGVLSFSTTAKLYGVVESQLTSPVASFS